MKKDFYDGLEMRVVWYDFFIIIGFKFKVFGVWKDMSIYFKTHPSKCKINIYIHFY